MRHWSYHLEGFTWWICDMIWGEVCHWSLSIFYPNQFIEPRNWHLLCFEYHQLHWETSIDRYYQNVYLFVLYRFWWKIILIFLANICSVPAPYAWVHSTSWMRRSLTRTTGSSSYWLFISGLTCCIPLNLKLDTYDS